MGPIVHFIPQFETWCFLGKPIYAVNAQITKSSDRYDFLRSLGSFMLHGVCQSSGSSIPVTFQRGISFPAPLERNDFYYGFNYPYNADMCPHPLESSGALSLEMTLRQPKSRLGCGRAGQAFTATVTSMQNKLDSDIDGMMHIELPPLCLKIVPPNEAAVSLEKHGPTSSWRHKVDKECYHRVFTVCLRRMY